MKEKKLKLAIVSPEIVPFSKVGGLADVIGALPDEIEKKGSEVTIFTPLYRSVDREKFGLQKVEGEALAVPVGGEEFGLEIFSAKKPGTGIDVYFLYNGELYDREGIYTVPDSGEAFRDEEERTVFFNRAVLTAMKSLDLNPDVIHCNDFHSGLIPALIELEERGKTILGDAATVFSIHNLAYQGNYGSDFMDKAGFDRSLFHPTSPFEYWGGVNVMKLGIIYSDIISTVSETYAEEITGSEEYGHGLEGVLRDRREYLIGILNGIDNEAWNPRTDDLIESNFSAADPSGKEANKRALLKEFGLKKNPNDPVIGVVSRFVDQKGFDILSGGMADIMKRRLKLVILGTGQKKYHRLYSSLEKKYPQKLGIRLEYNNRLAHLVEAGSDYFLMPSRYEPCGLNQMYSLRYGTIPIVRWTGGLKDTIRELTPKGGRGNGFGFAEYDADALARTIAKAVDFYSNKSALKKVRARIMKEDHSWKRSAGKYLQMYKKVVSVKALRLTTRQT